MFEIFFKNLEAYNSNEEQLFCEASFKKSSSISIDYAIMEKEKNVAVILSKFGWSDLGTWGSIQEISNKDQEGNSKNHDAIHMFGSSNSFVFSKERKTMLIDGLKDYIVIDTPDKLMILKGENEQRLKEYLAAIENTSTK